jgi:hypothetical protein
MPLLLATQIAPWRDGIMATNLGMGMGWHISGVQATNVTYGRWVSDAVDGVAPPVAQAAQKRQQRVREYLFMAANNRPSPCRSAARVVT